MLGGSCNIGAALLECQTSLFSGDARGRARVLLVLVAGSTSTDYSNVVGSLKTARVKIFAVGVGGLFVQAQITALTASTSNVLNSASFKGLADITGSVSTTISQGT